MTTNSDKIEGIVNGIRYSIDASIVARMHSLHGVNMIEEITGALIAEHNTKNIESKNNENKSTEG